MQGRVTVTVSGAWYTVTVESELGVTKTVVGSQRTADEPLRRVSTVRGVEEKEEGEQLTRKLQALKPPGQRTRAWP